MCCRSSLERHRGCFPPSRCRYIDDEVQFIFKWLPGAVDGVNLLKATCSPRGWFKASGVNAVSVFPRFGQLPKLPGKYVVFNQNC